MITTTTDKSGFTLVELMMAMAISVLLVAGVLAMFLVNQNAWTITTLTIDSSSRASSAINKIVYGFGTGQSLRTAEKGDVIYAPDPYSNSWVVSHAGGTRSITYDDTTNEIVDHNGTVLAEDVTAQAQVVANGLLLTVTINVSGGRKTANSTMTSFVRFRN